MRGEVSLFSGNSVSVVNVLFCAVVSLNNLLMICFGCMIGILNFSVSFLRPLKYIFVSDIILTDHI